MTSRASAIIASANRIMSPVTESDLCYIDKLAKEDLEYVLKITRENMKDMYDASGEESWKWDDEKKRRELIGSRFLFLKNDEGQSMGFCSFRFLVDTKRPVLYIYELQVHQEHTGKGIGSKILKKIEKFCNINFPGITHILLTCLKNNTRAIAFYSKNGFRRDSTCPANSCYSILSKVIRYLG